MEESLNYKIKCKFDLSENDIRTYSPLTLAYIGDGIYDLIIRSIVVGRGNTKVNALHHRTSRLVNAAAQAKMAALLEPDLTKEEHAVFRRGKNAKQHTMAKHSSVIEYKNATGFEAVMGYLYLANQMERLMDLVELALRRYHSLTAGGQGEKGGSYEI